MSLARWPALPRGDRSARGRPASPFGGSPGLKSLVPLVRGLVPLAAVLVADAVDVLRLAAVTDQAVLVAPDRTVAGHRRRRVVRARLRLLLSALYRRFEGGALLFVHGIRPPGRCAAPAARRQRSYCHRTGAAG